VQMVVELTAFIVGRLLRSK